MISILMRTQPDFDPAAARGIMTNILEQRSSPIRRGTYERYFEPWITPEEVQTGNPDSETNRLTWIPDIGDTIIRNYHVYYLSDTKSFVYYDGKTYVDDENFVGQLVLRALPEYGKPQTVTNQNHVLNYIKKFSYLKSKEFDADDTIMNFQNGIFDKKDRVLMPHDPDYLTLFISEYKYLPDCTQIPEITDRFLKSLEFSEDETRRLIYVLKALIEGDMSKMKFFVVFWGVTNSGKTKLAEKIGKLFGEPNERWKLIRLEKTGLQFGLQGLKNMNYVLIDDTGVDSLSSQSYSALKTLTSGSWCEGEDKYMPQSSFYVKFGVIITCNQLFKLPQSEEYSALVHRAKIFRFEKSHEKDEDFVNEFLENKEDNEQFLSYLLNLPKESLNNFHPLPDFEREEYGNAVTYWMQNASPINMLCATYIKRSEDTQVELNSLLYMLQTKARDSGININMTSKWARSKVEEFCLVNLGAIFLPPKKNSEGEYITWVRYIKADDVEIVPIVDNMPLENVIQESTPLTFQGLREEREREKEEDKESFTKADFTPLQKAVLRFIRKNDNPDTVIKVIDIKDGLRNEFPLQRDEIDSALMILEMSDEITMDRNGVIKINKKKEEKEGGMPK